MSEPFLNSDEFAERAHTLYLDGHYDEALSLLKTALQQFPYSAELHIGVGYARLAREEYAWARRAFEAALATEPDHEDALAGMGETLIKLGNRGAGLRHFDRIVALGFRGDHDLILQVGRALFREHEFDHARRYFEMAIDEHPESAEVAACLAYTVHRMGDEDGALRWLRRALEINDADPEVHIYVGNLLYDRGEFDAALRHYERTGPEDHVEELAMWRLVDLKRSVYDLSENDPEITPWLARFEQLAASLGPEDYLLAEIEADAAQEPVRDPRQLDFFGTLVAELQGMKRRPSDTQSVATADGTVYTGSWDDIVLQMKQDDREWAGCAVADYMDAIARQSAATTGVSVSTADAESFIRDIAAAGLVVITR